MGKTSYNEMNQHPILTKVEMGCFHFEVRARVILCRIQTG